MARTSFYAICTVFGIVAILSCAYHFVFHMWIPYVQDSNWGKGHNIQLHLLRIATTLDGYDELSDEQFTQQSKRIIDALPDHPSTLSLVVDTAHGRRVWFLVSPGPDQEFEFDRTTYSWIPYDPTNGINSTGDIVFGSRVNPRPFHRSQSAYPYRKRNDPGSWVHSYEGFVYVD